MSAYNDPTPRWMKDAGEFGAGSGSWGGSRMSESDIARQVAADLNRAARAEIRHESPRTASKAEAIAAASDDMHRNARHEAGHAVVARCLGLPVRDVSIDGNGGVSRFHASRAPGDWSADDDAAVLVAGGLAERMRWPDIDLDGCGDDEAALLDLLDQANPPDVRRAERTARMYLEGHERDVDTLVDALIRRRHLTGDEIGELLEGEERTAFLDRMRSRIRTGAAVAGSLIEVDGQQYRAADLLGEVR